MAILLEINDGEDKSCPFKNALRNNYKHIRKFGKRTNTDAFRIYDKELSSIPLTIDYYAGRFLINYFAKKDLNEVLSDELQKKAEDALIQLFNVKSQDLFWKTRAKTKGEMRQYGKLNESKEFFEVMEYGVKFYVNLIDYLDTGLFLDHRESRQRVAKEAKGKKLLNLFSYTASFSVHAAYHGAHFTKSVDMSNTYSAWGRENFILNGLKPESNEIVRADCLKFLDEEIKNKCLYDVIVIDPPTISRSKKMEELFDVQEDYKSLIDKSLKILSPEGLLFFSTNSRKFNFDISQFPDCKVKEITSVTIPIDFQNKKIHRSFLISRVLSKNTN